MPGFVIFIIVSAIVFSAFKKATEAAKKAMDDDDSPVITTTRYSTVRTVKTVNGVPETPVYGEGQSGYQHEPLRPTVHTGEPDDCEAHIRPQSSEGSEQRAHSATSHSSSVACDSHDRPVSTEGSSYLDSLRARKASNPSIAKSSPRKPVQQSIMASPVTDLPKTKKTSRPGFSFNLNGNTAMQAIVYSEVLGKPKSRTQR